MNKTRIKLDLDHKQLDFNCKAAYWKITKHNHETPFIAQTSTISFFLSIFNVWVSMFERWRNFEIDNDFANRGDGFFLY